MATTRRTHETRIHALELGIAELVSLQKATLVAISAQASAPATAAPATAKVESQFVLDMRARAAAKIPCELGHGDACNRRFSPKSSGRTNHTARIV